MAVGDEGRFPIAGALGSSVSVGAGGIDVEGLLLSLVDVGNDLIDSTGIPMPSVVVVGMSGLLELVDKPSRVTDTIQGAWPQARAVAASDSVTALVGALGMEGGAVVAAGTGVAGLGSDLKEVWHRADGWGHLLGDTGGGAWIGMAGLQAAMRTIDGRDGGSKLLLDLATRDIGKPSELPRMLYTRDDRAKVLASFVPAMTEAGFSGDPVALEIWGNAGRALAETAQAALVPGIPRRMALVGGLLAAEDLLIAPFYREVARRLPDVDVSTGGGGPLEGAAAMASSLEMNPASIGHYPPFITSILPKRPTKHGSATDRFAF